MDEEEQRNLQEDQDAVSLTMLRTLNSCMMSLNSFSSHKEHVLSKPMPHKAALVGTLERCTL